MNGFPFSGLNCEFMEVHSVINERETSMGTNIGLLLRQEMCGIPLSSTLLKSAVIF